MKTSHAILLWVAVAATASSLQAKTPVRITADNVNLRAKPQLTAEVVAQANYDDRLVARKIGEEWVEVEAPASADLWVMKSFVQMPQNTIGANRVNLRAGPSINYNIVATLSLGDTVEPRGEEIQDWIKVAPPRAARLWVSREYVEVLPDTAEAKPAPKGKKAGEVAAKAEETPSEEPKDGKKPERKPRKAKDEKKTDPRIPPATAKEEANLPTPIVAPSVPVKDSSALGNIPVPPPADLKLIPLEGQGRLTEVEGELRAAPLINEAPTRYRVVRWQNNRWQILCHVYGEAAKLRSLQDKRVLVKGREYWIQGAAAPVLVPDQVQELPPAKDTGQ